MARVFLSYDREDAGKARLVAQALEKAGHFVWWDLHIKGGAEYGKVIEQALAEADAVVVLWSQQSVNSAWVRDEAAAGRDIGRLVPVLLEPVNPPMGFRQYQNIDLTRWKGRGKPGQFRTLQEAIEALGGERPPQEAIDTAPKYRPFHVSRPFLVGITVAALVAAAMLFWRPWNRGSAAPVLAVVAAEQSRDASTLARDLLVQLGTLQATNPNAIELVGSLSERPDLILEVSGSSQPNQTHASLVLFSKDRVLLWSRDYRQPSDRQADLRQQLAYSAARVVECASLAGNARTKLSDDTRRLYLNGCAHFAESGGVEASASVVQVFEKIARAAPQFRDPWAKLLVAESELAVINLSTTGGYGNVAGSLRRHIAESRRHHPEIPEAMLAELALLPSAAFAERLKLAERAKALGPDNPHVLFARAQELLSVGRGNEAIPDVERALELDPLSPTARNAYISTLAYSGRLTAAEEALKDAERIWPGAATVLDAKFRFHLRYGNPAIALEIYREQRGTLRIHELTLVARLNRTPENIERAVQLATAALNRFGDVTTYSQVLAEFGREEEIYDTLAKWKGSLLIEGTDVLFRPTLKKFREDRRFMQLARRVGLVEFWRASGKWPEFCFDPDIPYDCKAEAAKLAA